MLRLLPLFFLFIDALALKYVPPYNTTFSPLHRCFSSSTQRSQFGGFPNSGTKSSELLCERVVELFHRDLAVAIVVEAAHELVLFVVGHVDVHPITKRKRQGTMPVLANALRKKTNKISCCLRWLSSTRCDLKNRHPVKVGDHSFVE